MSEINLRERTLKVGPPSPITPGVTYPYHLHFTTNRVFTAKYNIFTFFPKFFKEQFSKYSNFFFLFIALFQLIPGFSPTNKGATFFGLSVVLFMSAVKELFEDAKRRKSDTTANNARAWIFDFSQREFVKRRWANIKVGDVIRVARGQQLPADIIVVNSSEAEGLCFVETANIDGETNLKIRQAPTGLQKYKSEASLMSLKGSITCELPNDKIYAFEGKYSDEEELGASEIPLGPENILIRGSTLKNTDWVFGIAVYTGPDTKIVKNTKDRPMKLTRMEHYCNKQMVLVFGILISMSLMCCLLSMRMEMKKFRPLWSLPDDKRIQMVHY